MNEYTVYYYLSPKKDQNGDNYEWFVAISYDLKNGVIFPRGETKPNENIWDILDDAPLKIKDEQITAETPKAALIVFAEKYNLKKFCFS